jgi:hypothetical protein
MRERINRITLGIRISATLSLFCSLPALSETTREYFERGEAKEEYIGAIPSDCGYITESNILGRPAFFYIQPCNRGGGATLQEVPKVIRVSAGIIYLPRQQVTSGEFFSGYFCSHKAKRLSTFHSLTCSREGWIQQNP